MEIRIIATSYNFLTKEELLIKDGIGHLLNDNYLTYVEDFEDNNARHEIKWNDDEPIIAVTNKNWNLPVNLVFREQKIVDLIYVGYVH